MYIDFESAEELVDALVAHRQTDGYFLIMLADRHVEQLDDIIRHLKDKNLQFFGAVFPGLIVNRTMHSRGAVVKPVNLACPPLVIDLADENDDSLELLDWFDNCSCTKPMLYIFLDCLAPGITGFLDKLFNHCGNAVNYFGGGAGDSSLSHHTVIFDSTAAYTDAAVIAVENVNARVNVKHGWQRLAGPFIANKTRNNIISELNWEPAIDIYRRILPDALEHTASDEFFTRITPEYPLSIQKEGAEDVVRDPIRLTDAGELVCISDIPENSVMYMDHADEDKLIYAAGQAVEEATSGLGARAESCLVCDCYSRMLMFGDNFNRELETVADRLESGAPGVPLEGALVVGEIASDGEQSLEFYNKTFVVSITHA